MNAVLITGMSSGGKSTIAAVLARQGLASIDAASGAILIDARQPLDKVVDAILTHTLASSAMGASHQAE